MNNKSFEIQNQIRQNALKAHEDIKSLKLWEAEMKEKEMELKKHHEQQQESCDESLVSVLFSISLSPLIIVIVYVSP